MKTLTLSFLVLILALGLSGCGGAQPTATAVPTASPTPDPCSPANLPLEAARVNNLTRQFDDYAALAANTPQAQLIQIIPPMQAIRRAAEDLPIPACLQNLKRFQLLYMNTTLQTLLAFQSKASAAVLNAGIAQSRQYHDQYRLEMARLLGLTLVAPPSATAGAQAPQVTGTPALVTVINSGSSPLNLHVSASLTSQTVGTLEAGQSAVALGRSASGEWILIELPDQPGRNLWVYATLVKLNSGDPASLPVVTPAP